MRRAALAAVTALLLAGLTWGGFGPRIGYVDAPAPADLPPIGPPPPAADDLDAMARHWECGPYRVGRVRGWLYLEKYLPEVYAHQSARTGSQPSNAVAECSR